MKSIIKLRSLLPAYLKIKTLFAVLLMILVSISETLSIALLIPIIASIVSLLSSITLKHKITEDLKSKKETLSEKEIYLLQKLAGVKKPKK